MVRSTEPKLDQRELLTLSFELAGQKYNTRCIYLFIFRQKNKQTQTRKSKKGTNYLLLVETKLLIQIKLSK